MGAGIPAPATALDYHGVGRQNVTYNKTIDLSQAKNVFGFASPDAIVGLSFEDSTLSGKGSPQHYVRISTCSDYFDGRSFVRDTELYIFNARTKKLVTENDQCLSQRVGYRGQKGTQSCKGSALSCSSIALENDNEYFVVVTQFCNDKSGKECTVHRRKKVRRRVELLYVRSSFNPSIVSRYSSLI